MTHVNKSIYLYTLKISFTLFSLVSKENLFSKMLVHVPTHLFLHKTILNILDDVCNKIKETSFQQDFLRFHFIIKVNETVDGYE